MGLAEVELSMSDFEVVYDHISSYAPGTKRYGNMHLRQNRQRKNEIVLRYLHAMRVVPGATKALHGMICGPGLLWAYEIHPGRRKARLLVTIDEADDKERERIERRFTNEILKRVKEEQGGEHPPPALRPGHLYLRRSDPPMSLAHSTCREALSAKVLDRRFLSQILPWGFRLIRGRD